MSDIICFNCPNTMSANTKSKKSRNKNIQNDVNNYPEKRSGNERQKHGFEYENKKLEMFGLEKCKNYISEYDALCGDICVQVKCIKYGCAVELGDYFRNKRKTKDFIMIIGFWKGDKSNIVEEGIYYIDHTKFVANLEYDKDAQIVAEMNLITNLKEDDSRWKEFRLKYTKDYKLGKNAIDIRFKRDHKKQKRVQCAISWKNYNNWFKNTFTKLTEQKFEEMLNDINNNNNNNENTE